MGKEVFLVICVPRGNSWDPWGCNLEPEGNGIAGFEGWNRWL